MLDREQRVREIAHRLWEEEGRPADQEKRHWVTAEQIFDAQAWPNPHEQMRDTAGTAGTGKRRKERKGRRSAGPQDNLNLSG